MIIIDGITYNIPVKRIRRKAEFLDKYAERTEDGVLHRELIGVYFNYELEFVKVTTLAMTEEYALLWAKLTEAEEFHTVTVPDEAGDFTYTAYFSNVGDELVKETDTANFFRNLTVNFIAKEPENVP